jgi:hypothetical protein
MKTYYSPHDATSTPSAARSWAESLFVVGCVVVLGAMLWLLSTGSRPADHTALTLAHSPSG